MYPVDDQPLSPPAEASASHIGAPASLSYEPFYGLLEKPFSLSADPRFLFRSPAHGPAFDELHAGIRRREGLIVLTGEIGTGKTTLCRSVLHHLDRRTFAAFVADPFVSREDLLKTLLVDFGVISIGDLTRGRFSGASRSTLSYPLYEFLDSLVPLQAFAVIVIDEAQNLSLPLLEEIRILSELERREKLLQVVLVGQPELRSNLKLPEMRQVDQRVSVRCELASLDAAAVAGYVRHRLWVAGRGESRAVFTGPALEAIFEGSSGVPRLINRICDRALQRAFASQAMQIDAEFVWKALGDLGLSTADPVHDRVSHQEPEATIAPAIAGAPARPPLPVVATEVSTPSVPALPGLEEFNPGVLIAPRPGLVGRERLEWQSFCLDRVPTEPQSTPTTPQAHGLQVPLDIFGAAAGNTVDQPATKTRPVERRGYGRLDAKKQSNVQSGSKYRWMAGATAALAVSAAIGAPVWYSRALVVDSQELATIVPPRPAFTPSQAAVSPPPVETSFLPTLAAEAPMPVPAVVPSVRTAAPIPHSGYSIVVASFQGRDRAQRLVEELVAAGYGAHSTELDGGPNGRLVQVTISGYTSAIDVQRDLQRVRELPGGYGDARIVERD